MRLLSCLLLMVFAVAGSSGAFAQQRSVAPDDASVYFISPANGAVVSSPVRVRFGLSNMGVAPAGVNINGTGHHHLLIDLETLPPMDASMPASDQLRHYGGGQTETLLELDPGTHTLQLLMGNFLHIPHERPVISEKITITVR
ncbi:DUF4399 domain-containing protein [Halieaceae bacterium IMCC14734]|uniref:DUF4399 domain-containing protein n=1 Tax=Candidatus Litorirhabdus singularis TaxID=2518993 RepID=A0ABT3TBV7_9GAMM|nr:DUF4399 domain-containing protein [Candidatus Litorirhabdus singularis]MCX2979504.1 DUF4399 domain-containing protein [Candidatus Litorirhabdus singularis]